MPEGEKKNPVRTVLTNLATDVSNAKKYPFVTSQRLFFLIRGQSLLFGIAVFSNLLKISGGDFDRFKKKKVK